MTFAGYLLDASALLAMLNDEPGGDVVARKLPGAHISAVNLSEVATKLIDRGMPIGEVGQALDALQLVILPFEHSHAIAAAALRPKTRPKGLSLGDRACLAVAIAEGLTALTAERAWSGIDHGARVEEIR